MARSIEYLGRGFSGYGAVDFNGLLGLNYLLSFKDIYLPNSIFAKLDDGNHTVAGTSGTNGISASLTFGNGSTDVWLGGSAPWASTRISGGDGDHAILVDALARSGAQINLGDGNSIVQLGTAIGDTSTNITGGNGDFSVKAMDVRNVTLGDGDHLINVAKASYINVGNGDSYVGFKTGYGNYSLQISAGDGNHTLVGTSMAATNLTTSISFGDGVDGGGSILQLDGANGAFNVTGGSGDHVIQIEQMSKGRISLGDRQMSDLGHDVIVNIGDVTSQYGVQLSLGGGDHRVHICTHANDRSSIVSAGNGNSQVEIGVAKRVDLGDGDHVIDAGDVASIAVGDGNSQIAFEASSVNFSNSIEAGDGSHTIIGTSTTTGTSPTNVRAGDGNTAGDGSYIHLAGRHSNATVSAGDGDHTVKIDSTNSGIVRLGDGDHVVEVTAEGSLSKSSIEIGNGNTNLTVNGAGNVSLGAGNHVIAATDVTTIRTGAGEQQIFFEDGLNSSKTSIYTRGAGDDVVVGLGLSERPEANVETYDGDDTIVLLSGNWSGTSVRGGSGFDTVYVDERAKNSLNLNSIEQVVYLSSDLSVEEALTIAGVSHPDYAPAENSIHARDDLSFFAEATVRFDDLSAGVHQRVFDFGDGPMGNNVFLTQNADTSDMRFVMLANDTWYVVEARNALVAGETATWTAQISNTGLMQLFKDGQLLSETQAIPAPDVPRPGLLVGESHWTDNTPLIGEVVSITAEINGEGIAELAEFNENEISLTSDTLASLDPVESPQGIEVQPIEWFDIERKDFNLVALPDEESPAGAKLEYVEMAGKKTADAGEFDPASREDRLMEPTFDFFQRIEAYEASSLKDAFNSFFSTVQYNEYGDINGTNSSDVIEDTGGDSQIFAMDGDDIVDGSVGQDRIYGGKGNDVVRGGAGQDLLDGGDGYDVLFGGDDIDIFVFRKGEGTTDIQDFELSFDILDVEGFDNLTYEDLTASGRQVGNDVFYELGDDTLILRDAELASMIEIDLCMR